MMSTIAKLSGNDFDRMVARGAFVDLEPLKVELIYGELRFTNPAGPVHEGEIQFLMEWLMLHTKPQEMMVRVQSSINCGDHRPEPDLVWSRRMPAKRIRPTHADALLLIEVSDSSTEQDLGEKLGSTPSMTFLSTGSSIFRPSKSTCTGLRTKEAINRSSRSAKPPSSAPSANQTSHYH